MKLKSLIVDDDKKLLSVLRRLLIEEKHEVTACHNGLNAIEKCRENRFDLVITDLMMPGAGGLEVLKETRKIYPDTLVILITGFASLETAVQAIREGAYDYITKPFKLEEIKIVVNNAREKIRLIRENKRLFQELQEAYNQLHMVKKIMGEEKRLNPEAENNKPFIAGSMLPYYYQGKKRDTNPHLLPDLERISALKERGLLSDEEFNLCKSKLFNPMKH
ncbi:MAG: response regulator [Deltaproteobacteria bacterium]|nr:response regulator [Deltaproteobacteria bacterium]